MITQIEPSTIQQIPPILRALSSLSSSSLSSLVVSLDESIRRDLGALRHTFFIWLIAATVVVGVGVVLEEAENWLQYLSNALPLTEITQYRLAKKLVKLGWILIVIGVSGEGIFEVLVSRADALANAFDNILVTEARKQADDASTSAKTARKEAEAANGAAGKAQQKAGNVAKQADELNRELLAAKTQLATVDAKRAELEKSLVNLAVCTAPRVLPLLSIGNKQTSIDPLKPFARQAMIEFVPDPETRRAASNIAVALGKAGWKISRFDPADGIEDGVDVQSFKAPSATGTEEWYSLWQAEIRSNNAADAVVDFLHSYNWQAKRGWPVDERGQLMPSDSLRIRVGLYPAVMYVSPPGAKDFAAAIAQFEEERGKNRKQIEKEQLKREEEALKHLTEQQANQFKANKEEWNKKQKLQMERNTNPCQPLNPLVPSFR
jgi:hypothetical protein